VPRILVADDNTNIQKMVVLAFQERGIEVIAVGNGEAAVRRIPDANPDLVLADVFMPVRNGYEVCEFVKKDTRFAHIPVILLVGAFDPLDEKEARRVGADGVLKKPFVPPDPLIAMVMSALEKNPKVIAELARAKEVKEAATALAALPAAVMENPAMAEPKPLPEFPEPSPEEAAMIYGFGKGVRAIDSDEADEDEGEADARKSKSAQSLKDPQESQKKRKTPIAAAPKTPVVAMEEDDEESFDSSATASDWRRNAAELDVPDNVEANPIYSYGKNFEPITFPSERDVPPKHVRSEDAARNDDSERVEGHDEPMNQSSTAALPETARGAQDPASWDLRTENELVTQHTLDSGVDAGTPLASAKVEDVSKTPEAEQRDGEDTAAEAAAPVVAANAPQAPPPGISPEVAAHAAPEVSCPSFVARVRGWMDMMSPSSDEPSETAVESGDQHWTTSLAASTASNEAVEVQGAGVPAALQASDVENPVKLAEAEALAEDAAAPALVETAEATQEEQSEHASPANIEDSHNEPVPFPRSNFDSSPYGSDSERDTGDEADAVAKDAASSKESVHEEIHASASNDAMSQISDEASSEHAGDGAAEKWTALLSESQAEPGHHEPVAEHLPLEPMISDLREQTVASAASSEQEPSHVTEWLLHRANQSAQAENPEPAEIHSAEPAGDAWSQHNSEASSREAPFADQPEPSIFDREPAEAFAEEFTERIPTLPPPNREALSQIPFLMPDSEREPAVSENVNASNSAAVDEVVRRVLEKLQPQLHELLSQGVKPLVENMLQNELKGELHKNEK
jgi:CheY-like chemotaxis protein